MKYHIEKNTVQETLVIPLFGRLVCSERFPELFSDPAAKRICDSLDYDFAEKRKKMESPAGLFGALEVAQRQYDLRKEVEAYLKECPEAAVVNLGCGLDDTFSKVDNGRCWGYNLDFADVIRVRSDLLPTGERETNLACDLNDFTWMDAIDASNGVFFLAAGVFYYFKTEQMKKLLPAMAARFPGGRLCFDAANKRAVKIMLKTWVKDAGVTSISDYFKVDSLEADILPWMTNAKVTARGYMLGYNDLRDPSVPGTVRVLAKIADSFMNMQIIRMDFEKEGA